MEIIWPRITVMRDANTVSISLVGNCRRSLLPPDSPRTPARVELFLIEFLPLRHHSN